MRRLIASIGILSLVWTAAFADDWPQWMGPNRDGVWAVDGIVKEFPKDGPKILWRAAVAWGYAGPAVANGKVYVADFETDADIRKINNPAAKPPIKGKERLLCLDAKTGKELWKFEAERNYAISYPGGPRCTPTVADGKVYFLGAEGDLVCVDANSGSQLWSKDFKADYKAKTPIWGFSGHPLVDGKRLICVVGGDHATVVAFDKDTGAEIWKSLNANSAGYAPPAIIESAGKRQVLIWDTNGVNSLDPESGKPYWSVDLSPTYEMSIMAPQKSGDYVFTGGMGNKSVMLKLDAEKPAATEVWRGTPKTSIHPICMTPLLVDGTIYGCDQSGELMAVDIQTGKRLWTTTKPISGAKRVNNGNAFIVKNGDRYFLFNDTGDLIIAKLTPKGYEEISRASILKSTNSTGFGRDVVWSHPAFANKCMFARNDKEIVCVSLAAE